MFHPAAPLEDEDVEHLTRVLQRRIMRYLQRGGHLPREEPGEASQAEPEEPLLAELAAASIQGRVALGAKRGAPVSRLRGVSVVRPLSVPGQLCCRPLQELSQRYTTMQSAMASAERIFQLLDTEPEIVSPQAPRRPESGNGSIVFDRASSEYVEGQPVLTDMWGEAEF